MIFKINIPGFVQLRNSGPVVADIERRARSIAAVDPGLRVGQTRTRGGRSGRASVTVYAAPRDRDTLIRAMDAGRR
jgi:hypothetical protein